VDLRHDESKGEIVPESRRVGQEGTGPANGPYHLVRVTGSFHPIPARTDILIEERTTLLFEAEPWAREF